MTELLPEKLCQYEFTGDDLQKRISFCMIYGVLATIMHDPGGGKRFNLIIFLCYIIKGRSYFGWNRYPEMLEILKEYLQT